MWATWRRRSVGARWAWSPSTTSWPWAHVSISRAVMNDRAPIAGPYHGTRSFGSTVRATSTRWRRSARQRSSSSSAGRSRPCSLATSVPLRSSASASTRNASGSVRAIRARWSKNQRWVIWSRTVHPGAGVGDLEVGARDDPIEVLVLGGQLVTQRVHADNLPPLIRVRSTSPRARAPATPIDRSRSGLLGDALGRCPLGGRPLRRRLLGGGLLGRRLLGRRVRLAGARLAGAFLAVALLGRSLLRRRLLGRGLLGRSLLRRPPCLAGAFFAAAFLAGAFFAAAFLAGAFFRTMVTSSFSG